MPHVLVVSVAVVAVVPVVPGRKTSRGERVEVENEILPQKARKPPSADTEVVRRDARSTFHERNVQTTTRFWDQVE